MKRKSVKELKQGKRAVTAQSYQKFIIKACKHFGGWIEEKKLDALIKEKYSPLWSETDHLIWGNQGHPKWKQNVASAKSGLERRGVVVKLKERKTLLRVLLPDRVFVSASIQWWQRKGRFHPPKKQYEPLAQPVRVETVPDIE